MIDWQPIETVPDDDEYLFCCLYEDGSASFHIGNIVEPDEDDEYVGVAIFNGAVVVDEVTHWAVLEPPK